MLLLVLHLFGGSTGSPCSTLPTYCRVGCTPASNTNNNRRVLQDVCRDRVASLFGTLQGPGDIDMYPNWEVKLDCGDRGLQLPFLDQSPKGTGR